jgi:hypothetical protein
MILMLLSKARHQGHVAEFHSERGSVPEATGDFIILYA